MYDNTHPFRSGRWVFAHNGTIEDDWFLTSRISLERRMNLRGSTDSELLFALFLSRLDAAGITDIPSDDATDRVVADVVDELARHSTIGSYNFVLSDGETFYAQRRGRPLFVLERPESDGSTTALVASEAITDEGWRSLGECSLVRCRRAHAARWHVLRY